MNRNTPLLTGKGVVPDLKTRTNILRGCPALISAQAVDYSNEKRFAEINRRQFLSIQL